VDERTGIRCPVDDAAPQAEPDLHTGTFTSAPQPKWC
jgi:hypothetical protein